MTTVESGAPAFFRGVWLEPGQPEYEAAPPVFNQRIEGRPRVIARCAGTADVVAAIEHARERDLRIDVRSGGFGVGVAAGDGVVIDLSQMRAIQVVPERRIAQIQGGVRGGELQIEAALHGLGAATGALSGAGIGLMLGGGVGFLSARAGYASDNILAAELVTADREVVTASPEENPDLFWALCGSTGNFGVVTGLEVRLHEVPSLVHLGSFIWSFDNVRAGLEALRSLWDWAPEELSVLTILNASALEKRGGLEVFACHSGSPEQARADFERLQSFGAADEGSVEPVPFRDLHFLNDEMFSRSRVFVDEVAVDDVSEELVDALVAKLREPGPGGERFVEITPRLGAFGRAPQYPNVLREAGEDPTWSLGVGCWGEDAVDDAAHLRWTEEVCTEIRRIGPANGRLHPGAVGVPLGPVRLANVYGDRFERLRVLKRRWDPANVFSGGQNIPPADG